jgi:hypothetical protein
MGVKVPVRKYVKLRRMKTESKSCVDFAEKSTDEVLLACMYVVTNDEEYIRIQNMKRDGGEYEFEVLYSDMRSRLSVRIFDFRSSTKANFEFEEYVPENVGLGYRFFSAPNINIFIDHVNEALNSDIDYSQVIQEYNRKGKNRDNGTPWLKYSVIILIVILLFFWLRFSSLGHF